MVLRSSSHWHPGHFRNETTTSAQVLSPTVGWFTAGLGTSSPRSSSGRVAAPWPLLWEPPAGSSPHLCVILTTRELPRGQEAMSVSVTASQVASTC